QGSSPGLGRIPRGCRMAGPHRYLLQFDPRRTPHFFTDVLIIGAGIAGLRAALTIPADLEALVVSKESVQLSNSSWAQGGIARVRQASNVSLWEDTFTLDLLTHEGRCVGALVARAGHGPLLVWAKQTILASGGTGMVYRETTNPSVATGDGMAAAYRAGAELR